MKNILKLLLSTIILFGVVPTANAADMTWLVWKKSRRRKRRKVRRLVRKERRPKRVSFLKSLVVSKVKLSEVIIFIASDSIWDKT